MVNRAVDDEETIVVAGGFFNSDGWVLLVVLGQVGGQHWQHFPCDDSGSHIRIPFRQQQQNRFVDVVVNQHDVFFRGFDKVGGKDVGIKDLAVEKKFLEWAEERCGRRDQFCGRAPTHAAPAVQFAG